MVLIFSSPCSATARSKLENTVDRNLQDFVRRQFRRQRGEADQIREKNSCLGISVSNDRFTVSHAAHDGMGQNIEQERFGALLFDAQLFEMALLAVAQPFLFEARIDSSAQQDRIKRLRQIIFCTALDAAYGALGFIESGDHDHRNVPCVQTRLQSTEEFKSVHPRHDKIEQIKSKLT